MEDIIVALVSSHYGTAYLCAFGLFLVLESAVPMRLPPAGQLARWVSHIALALINNVVLRWAASIAGVGVAVYAQDRGWGLLNVFDVPLVVELPLTILLVDLTLFLCHRMYHANSLLWRFHAVHHSDRTIDISTGLRFHPFEACANGVAIAGATLLVGLSPAGLLLYQLIIGVDSLFGHANIKTPVWLDRTLCMIVVTPRFHHVHHAAGEAEHHTNFGIAFTFWDRLFGTCSHRDTIFLQSMPVGIKGCDTGHRFQLPWLLAQPFMATGSADDSPVPSRGNSPTRASEP